MHSKSSSSHWPISVLASLSALVTMVVPLVMVRLLSVDQIGTYKIFFLYATMLPVFALTTGLVNGLGYWAGQGQNGRRAIQLSNGHVFAAGFAIAGATLLAAPWVAARFGWPLRYAFYLPGCVLGVVCSNFLEESAIVTGKVWFGAAFLSSTELLRSAVVVAIAWLKHDLNAILAAYTLMSLAKVVASIAVGKRLGLVGFTWDRDMMRRVWTYAFPVSLSGLLGFFSNFGDQLILSNVVPPAEFAMYTIGCLTIPPLMILEQSVTRLMVPELSASFATGDSARAARDYRLAVEQLTWILIPAVTGLIVFAKPIIVLLFTARYAESAVYLRWFALTYLILAFPGTPVPRARGEGGWILKNALTWAPLPLVLCFLLGLKFTAFGVLWGIIIARAVTRGYIIYYIHRSTGWKWREFLPLGKVALFTATSAVLAALALMSRDALGGGLKWFLIGGTLFTILYFPLSLILINWRRRSAVGGGAVTRVLLFTQHLEIGGLERMVLSLADGLKKRDPRWQVRVFSHDSPETAAKHSDRTLIGNFLAAGVPVEAFRKKRGFSFTTLARLVRTIHRHEIDVLHSHDIGPLVYAVLANFLTLGRVRLVHTQHSFVHLVGAGASRKNALYEQLFTRFVDELIVVNHDLGRTYEKLGVAHGRIRVVSNGVDFRDRAPRDRKEKQDWREALLARLPEAERLALAPFREARWILYLARYHSVKGQRVAAELWRKLSPEARKGSVLIFVGPEAEAGERAAVERAFSGAPDLDRVLLLGGTVYSRDWIGCADLFLSCSTFEGMPLGPLEAIGSGLPAVLSAIPGHSFLSGVSRQFRTPEEGAGHLTELLFSRPEFFGTAEYYAELWSRTREIRTGFSVEAMIESYARLYVA